MLKNSHSEKKDRWTCKLLKVTSPHFLLMRNKILSFWNKLIWIFSFYENEFFLRRLVVTFSKIIVFIFGLLCMPWWSLQLRIWYCFLIHCFVCCFVWFVVTQWYSLLLVVRCCNLMPLFPLFFLYLFSYTTVMFLWKVCDCKPAKHACY